MNKRNLGNNGTKVFPIGLGGMSFSDAYGETNTRQTHEILSTAIDLGVDHIDTSDIYVIKQIECNVAITTEFRTWRQELRDLPNGNSFPINFPMAPSGVIGIITNGYYQNNLKSISMINDPIS